MDMGMTALQVGLAVLLCTLTVYATWKDNKYGDRSLRPSDLIKVLVQFLQYVGILGNISVPWPSFLTWMLTTAAAVFGVGPGRARPLDCWPQQYLASGMPVALQRQLSYFVWTCVIALACAVLMSLIHVCHRVVRARWRWLATRMRWALRPRLHFWSRLRVTLLVVAFYAYPALVKGALGFFACLHIDDPGQQPHPEYAIRNHTAGYWAGAIQQECFAGWHRRWALNFGLPAVVVLCVGVPVVMFVALRRSKEMLKDQAFLEHYGFLFRNYTKDKPWWEAVWAAETVLLSAVSVFHFTIQAFYALLAMQLILLLSAAAQVIARPYEQPLLHRLHLGSTSSLFLIVWLSLALFSESVEAEGATLFRAHTAFGVVILFIGCFFVMRCLVIIAQVLWPLPKVSAYSLVVLLRFCTQCVARKAQQSQALGGTEEASSSESGSN